MRQSVPLFACACRLSQVVARAKQRAEQADKAAAVVLPALLLLAGLALRPAAPPVAAPPLTYAVVTDTLAYATHGRWAWKQSDSSSE